jgi:hypothetical protein
LASRPATIARNGRDRSAGRHQSSAAGVGSSGSGITIGHGCQIIAGTQGPPRTSFRRKNPGSGRPVIRDSVSNRCKVSKVSSSNYFLQELQK